MMETALQPEPGFEAYSKPAVVLVVGNEDIFTEFMSRFSHRDYELIYAGDLDEAWMHCETYQPRLVVLGGERGNGDLASVLGSARKHQAMVLGLGLGSGVSAWGSMIDRVADPRDIDGVLQQAAELLGERRQRPRVDIKLGVHLEGIGNCTAKAISSTSLFVAADNTMAAGKTVEISIVTAEDKLACRGTVLRVGPGSSGEQGMVLGIPEHAMNFRAFLDATVRKALLVEQSRKAATADERAQLQAQALEELRESLSAEIEQLRHAQAVLRRTVESQVGLIQSLHQRIESLGRGQQNQRIVSEDNNDDFEEATKLLEFGESQALAEMSLWGQKTRQAQGPADRKITQVQGMKDQPTSRLHQIVSSFHKGTSSWSYVAVAAILVAFLTTLVALALYLKGINKPLASSTNEAGTTAVIQAPAPSVEQLSDRDQLRGGSDG